MSQSAKRQSAMATQEAMMLHIRGGGGPIVGALGYEPPFSTRKDRYVPTLPSYDPKFYSIAAHGSEEEALAYSFAGRLRQDFPAVCNRVTEVNRRDLMKFFDPIDLGFLGGPLLESVLEKIAWGNTRHEEKITVFVEDWMAANPQRFKRLVSTDLVIWDESEHARYGHGFLEDALKYLLAKKNAWLRSSEALPDSYVPMPKASVDDPSSSEPCICSPEASPSPPISQAVTESPVPNKSQVEDAKAELRRHSTSLATLPRASSGVVPKGKLAKTRRAAANDTTTHPDQAPSQDWASLAEIPDETIPNLPSRGYEASNSTKTSRLLDPKTREFQPIRKTPHVPQFDGKNSSEETSNTLPDLLPTHSAKSQTSNDSLSSLIEQDPAIVAAGLEGDMRVNPERPNELTTHTQEPGNTHRAELPLSRPVPSFNYGGTFPLPNTHRRPDRLIIPSYPPGTMQAIQPMHAMGPLPRPPSVNPNFTGVPFAYPASQQPEAAVPLPFIPANQPYYQAPYHPGNQPMLPYPGNTYAHPNQTGQSSVQAKKHLQKGYTDDARMLTTTENSQQANVQGYSSTSPSTISNTQYDNPTKRDVSGSTAYYSASSRTSSNQTVGPSKKPSQSSLRHEQHLENTMQSKKPENSVEGPTSKHSPKGQMTSPEQSQVSTAHAPSSGSIRIPKRDTKHSGAKPEGSYTTEWQHRDGRFSGDRAFFDRSRDYKKLHLSAESLTGQNVSVLCSPFGRSLIGPIIKRNRFGDNRSPYCFVEFDTAQAAKAALEALDGRNLKIDSDPLKASYAFRQDLTEQEFSSRAAAARKSTVASLKDFSKKLVIPGSSKSAVKPEHPQTGQQGTLSTPRGPSNRSASNVNNESKPSQSHEQTSKAAKPSSTEATEPRKEKASDLPNVPEISEKSSQSVATKSTKAKSATQPGSTSSQSVTTKSAEAKSATHPGSASSSRVVSEPVSHKKNKAPTTKSSNTVKTKSKAKESSTPQSRLTPTAVATDTKADVDTESSGAQNSTPDLPKSKSEVKTEDGDPLRAPKEAATLTSGDNSTASKSQPQPAAASGRDSVQSNESHGTPVNMSDNKLDHEDRAATTTPAGMAARAKSPGPDEAVKSELSSPSSGTLLGDTDVAALDSISGPASKPTTPAKEDTKETDTTAETTQAETPATSSAKKGRKKKSKSKKKTDSISKDSDAKGGTPQEPSAAELARWVESGDTPTKTKKSSPKQKQIVEEVSKLPKVPNTPPVSRADGTTKKSSPKHKWVTEGLPKLPDVPNTPPVSRAHSDLQKVKAAREVVVGMTETERKLREEGSTFEGPGEIFAEHPGFFKLGHNIASEQPPVPPGAPSNGPQEDFGIASYYQQKEQYEVLLDDLLSDNALSSSSLEMQDITAKYGSTSRGASTGSGEEKKKGKKSKQDSSNIPNTQSARPPTYASTSASTPQPRIPSTDTEPDHSPPTYASVMKTPSPTGQEKSGPSKSPPKYSKPAGHDDAPTPLNLLLQPVTPTPSPSQIPLPASASTSTSVAPTEDLSSGWDASVAINIKPKDSSQKKRRKNSGSPSTSSQEGEGSGPSAGEKGKRKASDASHKSTGSGSSSGSSGSKGVQSGMSFSQAVKGGSPSGDGNGNGKGGNGGVEMRGGSGSSSSSRKGSNAWAVPSGSGVWGQ